MPCVPAHLSLRVSALCLSLAIWGGNDPSSPVPAGCPPALLPAPLCQEPPGSGHLHPQPLLIVAFKGSNFLGLMFTQGLPGEFQDGLYCKAAWHILPFSFSFASQHIWVSPVAAAEGPRCHLRCSAPAAGTQQSCVTSPVPPGTSTPSLASTPTEARARQVLKGQHPWYVQHSISPPPSPPPCLFPRRRAGLTS